MNQSDAVVAKYGGTSMTEPRVVAEIIKNNPDQKIIVCSAPGKSSKHENKVTDLLINLAGLKVTEGVRSSSIHEILERFKELVSDLDAKFQAELLEKLSSDLSESSDYNFLISRGEYYSAWALSERIKYRFSDAKDLFCFDESGNFDRRTTKNKIVENISENEQVVIPGFYGSDQNGNIHLFGRGGSDRSGAILATALNLDYQNWTDVDGVMSADPRIVNNAKLLPELTYEEVREGAHGGASVLMGDTILDLEYGESQTILKNSFNPVSPGTVIKKTREYNPDHPVAALSSRNDLLALSVYDLGMRDKKGYVASILEVLAANKISTEHMPAAQDAITITFHDKLKDKIEPEDLINKIRQLAVSPSARCDIKKCGVVYMVGEALRELKSQHNVVISSLTVLESSGIVVLAVVMHPDSPSIAVIIDRNQVKEAQQILHKEYIG